MIAPRQVALLLALAGACAVGPVTAAFAARNATPRPHALKLFINGERQELTKIVGGGDEYDDIKPGALRLVARWQTDARGTGHQIVISQTEPTIKNVARCSTGRSCRANVRLLNSQEMTIEVRIVKTRTGQTVAGFKACLFGRA